MTSTLSRPNFLFKYGPMFRVEDVIRLGHLYFAPPAIFNDPFDCGIHLKFELGKKDRYRHYGEMLRKEGMNRAARRRATKEVDPSNELFTASYEQTVKQFRDRTGVLCLTEIEDDILMWSHYAEKHTGVCFKFGTDAEFFHPVQQVVYSHLYPTFTRHFAQLVEDLSKSASVAESARKEINQLFLTKADHWKYEREWRLLRFDLDRAHPEPGVVAFPTSSLVGVILGCCADPSSQDYVRRLIHETGSGARLYQAKEKPHRVCS